MSINCDYAKKVYAAIRGLNRSIIHSRDSIEVLNRNRAKKLARWEDGLSDINKKIANVESAYKKGLDSDVNHINKYFNNIIDSVNKYFEPQMKQLNSWCQQQQESFDKAIQPSLIRVQNTQAHINKLVQWMNETNNWPTKWNYQRQIEDAQVFLNRLNEDIAYSQDKLNERLVYCNPGTPDSVGYKWSKALEYWENQRVESLEYAEKKWITPARAKQLQKLNQAKDRIVKQINYLNSAYDAKIAEYNNAITFFNARKQALDDILSRVSSDCGSFKDCGDVSMEFPICGPNQQLVVDYDPCPFYKCEEFIL